MTDYSPKQRRAWTEVMTRLVQPCVASGNSEALPEPVLTELAEIVARGDAEEIIKHLAVLVSISASLVRLTATVSGRSPGDVLATVGSLPVDDQDDGVSWADGRKLRSQARWSCLARTRSASSRT